MTASFPWYDLPSVQWANDAIWAATGIGGSLDRATPVAAQWRADDLVVSQCCGLDLFLAGELAEELAEAPIEPVLAPVFDLDCQAGHYYSYLVGAREGIAAVNSLSSRSGLSALLTVARPTALLVTGAHTSSLAAVRSGRADMACIDAVTFGILARDTPDAIQGVKVLERTCAAPAPPYVVRALGKDDTRRDIATRIAAALESPDTRRARQALLMRGVMPVTARDYASVWAEYQSVVARIPASVATLVR